jgi:hypothetical protein
LPDVPVWDCKGREFFPICKQISGFFAKKLRRIAQRRGIGPDEGGEKLRGVGEKTGRWRREVMKMEKTGAKYGEIDYICKLEDDRK